MSLASLVLNCYMDNVNCCVSEAVESGRNGQWAPSGNRTLLVSLFLTLQPSKEKIQFMCVCVCVCVCIYIYIFTHTHTHTHTYTMCIYIYLHTHTHTHTHIPCVYIYIFVISSLCLKIVGVDYSWIEYMRNIV